jgi:hypothetical protein
VQALGILPLFVGVATTAVDRGELLGVRKVLFAGEVRVAIGAFQCGMRRRTQSGGVERRRNSGLALARAAPGVVASGTLAGAWRGRLLLRAHTDCAEENCQQNHTQAQAFCTG